MLQIHSQIYQEQYGENFICVIPTNIYGEHDNYSLENGHVIPSLIHKCYLAKTNKTKFNVRGTGKPLRQFIYSVDLAKLIMWSLLEYTEKECIILSVDEKEEISIREIANFIAKEFNYHHQLEYDHSYSDGQYKKTVDNSRLKKLYPDFQFTDIKIGLSNSIYWFVNNYPNCRC
jgi:GDP-L-fucose synthase